MNPAVILGLLFLGSQALKKKGATGGGSGAGSPGKPSSTKPNLPGSPTLTVDDINDRPGQLLDNVKYTFTAGGQSRSNKHQSRKENPTQEVIGDYLVIAQTDPNVREGEKKPDVIMLIVRDRDNRTVIAKRIIVGEKQIIDIQ